MMNNKRAYPRIRAVLIEDEKKSLLTLKTLLSKYCPEVDILGSASTVGESLDVIPKLHPELVFLDIAMPDGDAFDLLNRLPEINFDIIFTTAYNDYALKAFDFSAIHYLLKPVNHTDLIEAIRRFQSSRSNNSINERIQILNQSLNNNFVKISLPTVDGLIILEIDKIIRIEADSNYCHVHLIDETSIVVSRTLNQFEEILANVGFFRIHSSHIVNIKYVTKYNKGRGGLIILDDGSQVSVSASRKKEFLNELSKGIVTLK